MADERPDRNSGNGGNGPGDQGRGGHRGGGRRRGFRGRHGNGQEREAQGGRPQNPGGSPERRDQGSGRQPGRENPQPPREQVSRAAEEPRLPDPRLKPEDMPSCPICGKPIYDLSTAVSAAKESGEPAHFDCVLERVAAAESLAAGEKLVYLGSGAFGVVEIKDKNEGGFSVKRRIQWEKEGEKKDWRKSLSSRIANL